MDDARAESAALQVMSLDLNANFQIYAELRSSSGRRLRIDWDLGMVMLPDCSCGAPPVCVHALALLLLIEFAVGEFEGERLDIYFALDALQAMGPEEPPVPWRLFPPAHPQVPPALTSPDQDGHPGGGPSSQ